MQVTKAQAYLAMWAFLDKQYALGWRGLGGLLSALSTRANGATPNNWTKTL